MKIIILAGGFGTRLQSVVKDVPKPMADIKGSPFLDLLMQKMIQYGADEFVLCVSYKKECIINYFGDYFYGVPVRYSIEEEPLGTGGAIKQAFEQFDIDNAIVINGDTYVEMDYADFYNKNQSNLFSMALKQVDNANRYGQVEVQNNKVIKFNEKTENNQAGLINAGVYLINKELFKDQQKRKFSFEKDLMESSVSKVCPNYYIADDYFIDIGIPESYAQACAELKSVVNAHKNKALFLDRDGVINEDVVHLYQIEKCQFMPNIFDLCRNAKTEGYKIVVVTNQAGIAKGIYTEEDYFKLRDYIHTEFRKQYCPIDAEYFCPDHPEGQGKYRRNSYHRKPNPGMILQAVQELDIDLKKSVLIGDNETDIIAGKNAGVGKTIRLINEKNMHGNVETIADEVFRVK